MRAGVPAAPGHEEGMLDGLVLGTCSQDLVMRMCAHSPESHRKSRKEKKKKKKKKHKKEKKKDKTHRSRVGSPLPPTSAG